MHIALFVATVFSMFLVAFKGDSGSVHEKIIRASQFSGTLTLILLFHEFGHYFAARIHKVETSLPFFIPLPIPDFSLLGTMGAVIKMRGVIPNRRALLDIGASGPLAGLLVAIPAYFWGSAHSTFAPINPEATELGESIASRILDHFASGPAPAGMELQLSPVAFAAWGGMLVTMINLFPISQLDGGHITYALFGKRHHRIATTVHRAMIVFFFVSVVGYLFRDIRSGLGFYRFGERIENSLFWFVWYQLLAVIGSVTASDETLESHTGLMRVPVRILGSVALVLLVAFGLEGKQPTVYWIGVLGGIAAFVAMDIRGGLFREHALLNHPEVPAPELGIGRKIVAIVTLLWFVLLFMPAPISI